MPLRFLKKIGRKLFGDAATTEAAPAQVALPAPETPAPPVAERVAARPTSTSASEPSGRGRGDRRRDGDDRGERRRSGGGVGGHSGDGARGRAEVRPARAEARPRREAPAHDASASLGTHVDPEAESSAPWSLADFVVPPEEGRVRFHDMELPDPIMHAIADLGFQYCTPIQAKVLTHVRSGQNVAGRAQTGTGKTAAFLICIFNRFLSTPLKAEDRKRGAPRALVLAPTRELVIQIAEDAHALGRHCPMRFAAVFGGMDFDKQRRTLENNHIDLLAATPGRLLDFARRGVLDLSRVEVLVIDEADRMLDMGFIPDVRSIVRMTPPKERRQAMLFSATLSEPVLRLASQWMPDPVICEVESEKVTVDTTEQDLFAVTTRDKFTLLYNLLTQRDMQRVLVFSNRRDDSERLAERLRYHGIQCALLSGAVAQKRRLTILDEFRAGKLRVVVATDVAARGIHVDDIDYVINYDFPYEPEDYVHRIGRTGRAGARGRAISFACEEESFIIPEIEKYIGRPLACTVPDDALLVPPPQVHGEPRPLIREHSGGGRRDHGRSYPRRDRRR